MRYYFFSDLHLLGQDDPFYRVFLNKLSQIRKNEKIFLCGDIFDVFVGNKHNLKAEYRAFFQVLKGCSNQGVKIYFIEGNHDFHMKQCFVDEGIAIEYTDTNFKLSSSSGTIIYCAHGDLINKNDRSYLMLRGFYRSCFFRFLLKLAPGSLVLKVGRSLSRYSRSEKPLLPESLPEQKLREIREVYHDFCRKLASEAVDFVILGHCHDLDEKKFNEEKQELHYMNMGYPKVHGYYIVYDEDKNSLVREKFDAS